MKQSSPKDDYDMGSYWSSVAQQIQQRGPGHVIAGDDSPLYRSLRERFLKEFEALHFRDKVVLEVGCGPGGNLRIAAQHGPKLLIGCDVSGKMLELALENLRGIAKRIRLIQTNGSELPLEDQSVDDTFTVTVLNHVTDDVVLDQLVSEVCRVTRREIFLFEETSPIPRKQLSFVARTVPSYRAVFEKHGFVLTERKQIGKPIGSAACGLVRRLTNPRHREGEPIKRLTCGIEAAILPITDPVDRFLQIRSGHTKMVFSHEL